MTSNAVLKKGEATRQSILAVATQSFASNGYAGTRLDQIAGELGVTRQTLLFHFKDKAGLYQATLERLFKDRDHALETRDRDEFDSLAEYIDSLVTDSVVYYLDHPEFAKMMLRFLMSQEPRASEPQPTVVTMLDRWQAVLKEGIESGQTREVPLSNLISIVAGTLSYYILLPGGAQSGEKLLAYDPNSAVNVGHVTHSLQLSVRGMLGLPTQQPPHSIQ
jgi:AcrR family transcriptional regulator